MLLEPASDRHIKQPLQPGVHAQVLPDLPGSPSCNIPDAVWDIGGGTEIPETVWEIGGRRENADVACVFHPWLVALRIPDLDREPLFVAEKDLMVVVHGFIKKSRKTPRRDLELARRRAAELKGDRR